MLTSGQSTVTLEGGNITFACPGTFTVKGGAHGFVGPASQPARISALPSGTPRLQKASVGSDEATNAAETVAQILELAKNGSGAIGNVVSAVDYSELSASALNANIESGRSSWEMFRQTSFSPNPGLSYVNFPINWNKVDWSKFASPNDTYPTALKKFEAWAKSSSVR